MTLAASHSSMLALLCALALGCSSEATKEPTDDSSKSDDDDDGDDDGDGEGVDGTGDRDASTMDAARDAAKPPTDAAQPDAGDGALKPVDASLDAAKPDGRVTNPSTYDWVAGDYPPNLRAAEYLHIDGIKGQTMPRDYKVHVPKGYDPAKPTPVLFALHGWQQNAVMFTVDGTSFIEKSEEEGFIVVMPNGVQQELGGSWNAGVCCGAAASQKLDDVAFVRAVYGEVQKHLNVDTTRVYAAGLSNGGFFTHRLGCEAADIFVAIAPLAGSIGTPELGSIGTNPDPDMKECKPSQPVAVLAMHGNADGIVPYSGLKPTLDHWAKENGCSTTTSPATQPVSGGDTTCVTYGMCKEGVEVTGCTVAGGGHCWFGNESCGTGAPGIGNLFVGNNSTYLNATDAAWDFLKRFHR